MSEEIKKVILKYKSLIPKKIFERNLKIFKTNFNKANVIIGPRRAGKTFFLYSLINKQKNKSNIFINFEDNLLINLNQNELGKISDYAKELFEGDKVNFFFDEIQTTPNWEKNIISLLNENYKIYITGSNSRILSKEIASSLRGKSLSYLLLPFSFKEFLKIKKINLEKNWELTDKKIKVKKSFNEFFKYGGFPEITLANSIELKNKLINNYFDSVLYKDIVDRLNFKNIKLVEVTIKYLLNLFSNTFSIAVFENYLKSNKIPYSLEEIYKILKAVQDVFMINYVKEYFKSFKKTEASKSKIYLFDQAYIHFLANEYKDKGRILENIVFIELFRREKNIENKNIFYLKNNKTECDFLITKRNKIFEAIQVTYELNEKNQKRELNGLINALNQFNLKKGLILTYNQEKKIIKQNKKITIKPVWKWLLEQKLTKAKYI